MLYLHTTDKNIQEILKNYFKLSKVMTYPGELFQNKSVKLLYTSTDFYQISNKIIRMLCESSFQKNDFIVSINSSFENNTASTSIINKISQPDFIDCYPDILIKHAFEEKPLTEQNAYHFYRIVSDFFACDRIIILRTPSSMHDSTKVLTFLENLISNEEVDDFKYILDELNSRCNFSYAQMKIIENLLYYRYLKKDNIKDLLDDFYREKENLSEAKSYEELKRRLSI